MVLSLNYVHIIHHKATGVKMFFLLWSKTNVTEFRGATHDLGESRIILLEFTKIFVNYLPITAFKPRYGVFANQTKLFEIFCTSDPA